MFDSCLEVCFIPLDLLPEVEFLLFEQEESYLFGVLSIEYLCLEGRYHSTEALHQPRITEPSAEI